MSSLRGLKSHLRGGCCAAVLVLVPLALIPAAHAQQAAPAPALLPAPATPPSADKPTYTPTLTFDVASVRETERGSQLSIGLVYPPHASSFSSSSVSLRILLLMAYGPTPFQVSGGPDWLNDRYFTVQAKSDPSVDAQLAKLTEDEGRQEKQHMLQALLADRFHLRAHWETKEGSVYALTVAKGGVKMQPTKLPIPDAGDPNAAPATPSTVVHAHGSRQGIEIDGERFAMRSIAAMLTTQLGVPVIDKTGVPGYFDFALQFSRDDMGTPDPDSYPSIAVAAQEQMGLRVESTKGPVDTLVIDHLDSPSEN